MMSTMYMLGPLRQDKSYSLHICTFLILRRMVVESYARLHGCYGLNSMYIFRHSRLKMSAKRRVLQSLILPVKRERIRRIRGGNGGREVVSDSPGGRIVLLLLRSEETAWRQTGQRVHPRRVRGGYPGPVVRTTNWWPSSRCKPRARTRPVFPKDTKPVNFTRYEPMERKY